MNFYDEKEKRFLPYLGGLPAAQLAVSPDRKWMVYSDYPRGYLWRCKIDGSEKSQLTSSLAQMVTWSPDSKWIAYSDWNELYRVSVDGGPAEKLTSQRSAGGTPAPQGCLWVTASAVTKSQNNRFGFSR